MRACACLCVCVWVGVSVYLSKDGELGRKIKFLANTNELLNQTLFMVGNVLSGRNQRINQS